MRSDQIATFFACNLVRNRQTVFGNGKRRKRPRPPAPAMHVLTRLHTALGQWGCSLELDECELPRHAAATKSPGTRDRRASLCQSVCFVW